MSNVAIDGKDINVLEHKHVSKNTGKVMYQQFLLNDDDTEMMIKQIRYPKGVITSWHTHNCAHGCYVLEGTLYCDSKGNGPKGEFGVGSFVWWEEGDIMEHGGKNEDVEVLFITNKKFDINYL